MRIVLNGSPRELAGEPTVAEAVGATGAAASRGGLAVAVDGEIIPRGEWERTRLHDGQHVEVLSAVQGGS